MKDISITSFFLHQISHRSLFEIFKQKKMLVFFYLRISRECTLYFVAYFEKKKILKI